jgi:NDP-sugar pyrophosphorylase family protein
VFGAIVIVGTNNLAEDISSGSSSGSHSSPMFTDTPPECIELLGRSVLQRTIENLRGDGVEMISLVSGIDCPANVRLGSIAKQCAVPLSSGTDVWSGAVLKAKEYCEAGAARTLLICGGLYIELDLPDLARFHESQRQEITSVHDEQGPLGAWLIESTYLTANPEALLEDMPFSRAGYIVPGYAHRLHDSGDLRRLAADALQSRCQFPPQGQEIQPGVWMGEKTDVHRSARLIGPAYIGAGSRIGKDCVISECSNIERDCQIDDGTTVLDSSVLENTYLGIGLQVSHSIVNGSHLQSLEHDTTVAITDAAVMRRNKPERKEPGHAMPVAKPENERVIFAPAEESAS